MAYDLELVRSESGPFPGEALYDTDLEDEEDSYETDGLRFNFWMMGFVREFLREAGAVRSQPGFDQAFKVQGFEPGPLSVPIEWFCDNNDDDIVSPDQARFMAARVRAGMESEVMDMFGVGLFDDEPEEEVIRQWLEEFAEFNERAARGHGYRVC